MRRIVIILAISVFTMVGSQCFAQRGSRSAASAYGRATRNVASNILNRPTVSPYLRLLQGGGIGGGAFGGGTAVYQTQVRPQMERRQQSQQQQAQIQQIQGQLNEVRQQYRKTNSGYMTTGHPTRFMSYSHYYPIGR